MKTQTIRKNALPLFFGILFFIGISHRIIGNDPKPEQRQKRVVCIKDPIATFCHVLETLLDPAPGDNRPLIVFVDELLCLLENHFQAFVKQLKSNERAHKLIATLKEIRTRAIHNNISAMTIGSMLKEFLPYLPEDSQKKINATSFFGLMKLAKNLSRRLEWMRA